MISRFLNSSSSYINQECIVFRLATAPTTASGLPVTTTIPGQPTTTSQAETTIGHPITSAGTTVTIVADQTETTTVSTTLLSSTTGSAQTTHGHPISTTAGQGTTERTTPQGEYE